MQRVDYVFTQHGAERQQEREIPLEWVERVLFDPQLLLDHETDPELAHAISCIPEYGNRALRVVYNKTTIPLRIVSIYFDRKYKGKL